MDSRNQLREDLKAVRFGIVEITPVQFAGYVEKFVHFGSKRYTLSKEDLTVYSLPDDDFDWKSQIVTTEIEGKQVPATLESHLLCGTKFLDAVLYMYLEDSEKPGTTDHDKPATKKEKFAFDTYDDYPEIAKCMFFYYFYVLTRARAPEAQVGNAAQPVPKFLQQVLSIKKSPGEVAEYLASFKLTDLDPAWVRSVNIQGLSQESLGRFGLGVAGYRLAAPFKLRNPDGPEASKFTNAIAVARSFATAPACWGFHPATRNPDILTKYGNVNKNLSNLMLATYKKSTLEIMKKARIIFDIPEEDPNHTNYLTWTLDLVYATSAPIFPSSR